MNDQLMSRAIYDIEKTIHDYDERSGRKYNDSVTKTALVQTKARLSGKEPKKLPANEKDQFKHDLSMALMGLINRDDSPYSEDEFKIGLTMADSSLKRRREYHQSPRGYLDYLIEFMAQFPFTLEEGTMEE